MNTKMSDSPAAHRAGPRRMRVFASLALLTTATAAFGQTTAAAPKDEVVQLEKFVARGSRFNDRTVTQSPVPIAVISGTEMKHGGHNHTSQMARAPTPSLYFPRPSLTARPHHIPAAAR